MSFIFELRSRIAIKGDIKLKLIIVSKWITRLSNVKFN
jgi:hypothetical protein